MQFRLRTLLLAATILPPLVGLFVHANTQTHVQSKQDSAKSCLKMLSLAATFCRQEFGDYPPDLAALQSDVGHEAGPILTQPPPLDPWGNAFRYERLRTSDGDFRIWSCGPDGVGGTEDDIEESHKVGW